MTVSDPRLVVGEGPMQSRPKELLGKASCYSYTSVS